MAGDRIEHDGQLHGRTTSLLWPGVVTLSVLLAKAAYVLRCDIRRLAMAPWVLDDSFILMRIARNVALGLGYTYDGVRATSGAPPLWIWLTSLNHLFLQPVLSAKATLIESCVFGGGAAIMVFVIARRLFGGTVAWAAFVLATLLTPLFMNSLGGMDAPLFTFLGLVAVWLYLLLADRGGGVLGFFGVGCVLGLTNLARADGVFLTVAVLAVETAGALRAVGRERRDRLRRTLALVLGVTLLSLPLAAVCLRADGTVIPCNQLGRRLIALETVRSSSGALVWRLVARRLAYNVLSMQSLLSLSIGSGVLAVLAVVSGLLQERGRRLAQLAAVYCGSYIAMLALYQWFFPDVHGLRYLSLPAHVLVIVLAAFLHRVVSGVSSRFGLRGLTYGAVVSLLLMSSGFQYREIARAFDPAGRPRVIPAYPEETVRAWWRTVDWIASNLPQGTIVAASDHGVLSYFTGVRVVDLDGVVDSEPIKAAYRGTIAEVLRERGVEYVLLWPGTELRCFHTEIRGSCKLDPIDGAPEGLYRLGR